MSIVANKYREIALGLLELAKEVNTIAERDASIAMASYCLSSARAVEDHARLQSTLRVTDFGHCPSLAYDA